MRAPQLARQLATIDQMLDGRPTTNIISSDLPGQSLESAPRYRRTLEVMPAARDLFARLCCHSSTTHHCSRAESAPPISCASKTNSPARLPGLPKVVRIPGGSVSGTAGSFLAVCMG